jgi:hypothetical protein
MANLFRYLLVHLPCTRENYLLLIAHHLC